MRFSLPLLAIAAVAAPLSAAPQTDQDTVTVRITFADLDVTSPEGRAALEQRIEEQVRAACTIEKGSRYRYGARLVDESCTATAREEALASAARVAASKARGGRQVAAN